MSSFQHPLLLSLLTRSKGLHLLPHSVAISTGSVFAGYMMRRTGKLYTLTLVSAALAVSATVATCFWNKHTSQWHLWLDIVPQGLGMSSLITTTLIVCLQGFYFGSHLTHFRHKAMIAGVSKEDLAVATGSKSFHLFWYDRTVGTHRM